MISRRERIHPTPFNELVYPPCSSLHQQQNYTFFFCCCYFLTAASVCRFVSTKTNPLKSVWFFFMCSSQRWEFIARSDARLLGRLVTVAPPADFKDGGSEVPRVVLMFNNQKQLLDFDLIVSLYYHFRIWCEWWNRPGHQDIEIRALKFYSFSIINNKITTLNLKQLKINMTTHFGEELQFL